MIGQRETGREKAKKERDMKSEWKRERERK